MNFVKEFNTKADILIEKYLNQQMGKHQLIFLYEINRETLDEIALVKSYFNKFYII